MNDRNTIPVITLSSNASISNDLNFLSPKKASLKDIITSDADFRGLIVFGEHPRELVPSEVALRLVQDLCKESPGSETTTLSFASGGPLVNRWGRDQVVSEGNLCLRNTKEHVDLNRDFPISEDLSHKTQPTSKEGLILKNVIDNFRPNLYLDVHSGSKFIGYSPAVSKLDDRTVLRSVKKKFLKDFLHAIPERTKSWSSILTKLGYESPGSAVDYVYANMKNPVLSFAIEVFEEDKHARAQGQVLADAPSTGAAEEVGSALQKQQCFYNFNPASKAELDEVTTRWSGEILRLLAESMSFFLKQDAAQSP